MLLNRKLCQDLTVHIKSTMLFRQSHKERMRFYLEPDFKNSKMLDFIIMIQKIKLVWKLVPKCDGNVPPVCQCGIVYTWKYVTCANFIQIRELERCSCLNLFLLAFLQSCAVCQGCCWKPKGEKGEICGNQRVQCGMSSLRSKDSLYYVLAYSLFNVGG